MNFRFDLVAIFLILDTVSIQAIDDSTKKGSSKVRFNSHIANNSFRRLSSNFPIARNRNSSFLHLKGKNENTFLPNSFVSQTSNIAASKFIHSFPIKKAFINPVSPDILMHTEFPNSPRPSTQISFTPLPYYHTTPVPNIPILSTSAPINNNFTTSDTHISTTQSRYIPTSYYHTTPVPNVPVFSTRAPVDNDFTTSHTHIPTTQSRYIPSSYYHTTPVSNVPVFSTPAPVDNDFTTPHTHIPITQSRYIPSSYYHTTPVPNVSVFSTLASTDNDIITSHSPKILFPDSPLLNNFALQSSKTAISNYHHSFSVNKSLKNPIRPNTIKDTEFPNLPKSDTHIRTHSPTTQSSFTPLPYDHTTPVNNNFTTPRSYIPTTQSRYIPTSYYHTTPVPNALVFSTPASTDNDITTSRTRHSPKILFPDSPLLNNFALQSSKTAFSNYHSFSINPLMNTIRPDTHSSTTQSSATPLPYDHTTPASSASAFSIPVAVDNDFIMSPTESPNKIYFPDSLFLIPNNTQNTRMSSIKTRSKFMCDKYERGDTSASLSSSPAVNINSACENTNPLVVNGKDAEDNEFPHMVALGRGSSKFIQTCGGTLISHTWVLTAAHCTHTPNGGFTHAKLGISSLSDQGIIVEILHTTKHPDYKPPVLYNDIALTRLKGAVNFDTCVQPACLYQARDTVPEKAWVTGWGATTTQGGTTSDRLQKAELDLVDNEFCKMLNNISLGIPQGIISNMICAYDMTGNRTSDTCQGDSGGPLQIFYPESNMYHVLGITSFGNGCARKVPAIYTRVSHYLKWIEDIVWSQEE